jgi:predicted amidohydrolase YtcJ
MVARRATAVFFNGKIHTFDKDKPTARAIAIADGRIVAVGDDASIKMSAPRGIDKFDLGGRTVVPGFTDCHTHFISMGVDSMTIDLSQTRSIDDALALIKAGARNVPEGKWVIAVNWKESGWRDGRFITRADLDVTCPKHPAVAHRVCGHMSSVNSKAVELLGIDAKTPDVEVDSAGRLTGVLLESSVSIVRDATAPDRQAKMKGLMLAMKKAHSYGVTSIHDNGEASHLGIYRAAESAGKLSVRVWFNTPSDILDSRLDLSIPTGVGSDFLKIGGVKIFCDGALGARTAALSSPFSDDPGNKGMFVHSKNDLDKLAAEANEADIQLAIHAIGDAGIGAAIDSISSALERCPRKDHRHRIEHLELPTAAHLSRMRRLKIIASMQPNFIGEWGGTDGMYISRLGKSRASRNNPFREVLNAKVRLVFGSDCMPFSPIYGIHSAVNAPYPAQKVSVGEALAAYTRDAAFPSFEENIKGTISEGKFADFVVLSRDPFEEPSRISSINVLKTVVGGEVVFDRPPRE